MQNTHAPGRRRFCCAVAVCGAWGWQWAEAAEGNTATRAMELAKARLDLLTNLARYVSWPPKAPELDRGVFEIVVHGDDNSWADLSRALSGKVLKSRAISVRRAAAGSGWIEADMVVLSRADSLRLRSELTNSKALTVGERDGFLEDGGIINLLLIRGKLRFEVNQTRARQAGLHLSAWLLRAAETIL